LLRVPYDEMFAEFLRVLKKNGFTAERAERCARIFAQNSLDGVASHGLNRFPDFIDQINRGLIDVNAEATLEASFGALERWEGNLGPGILNATLCMARAVSLAKEYGVGSVALKNTNHWMRAGTYGWQAADAGCIGICWTNTPPLMPPWGAKEAKVGNNQLVIAIPCAEGHIVVDIAMTLFSIGKMQTYQLRKEQLPMVGGYDSAGNLTCDPGSILDAKRPLPIGYWKGSGLAMLLDLTAIALSGGLSTRLLGMVGTSYKASQVFLVFDLSKMPDQDALREEVELIVAGFHAAAPVAEGQEVRFPGEGSLRTRRENLAQGAPVDESIWEKCWRCRANEQGAVRMGRPPNFS